MFSRQENKGKNLKQIKQFLLNAKIDKINQPDIVIKPQARKNAVMQDLSEIDYHFNLDTETHRPTLLLKPLSGQEYINKIDEIITNPSILDAPEKGMRELIDIHMHASFYHLFRNNKAGVLAYLGACELINKFHQDKELAVVIQLVKALTCALGQESANPPFFDKLSKALSLGQEVDITLFENVITYFRARRPRYNEELAFALEGLAKQHYYSHSSLNSESEALSHAISLINEALFYLNEIKHDFGPKTFLNLLFIKCYLVLATFHLKQANPIAAAGILVMALQLEQKIHKDWLCTRFMRSLILQKLAKIFQQLGQTEKAQAILNEVKICEILSHTYLLKTKNGTSYILDTSSQTELTLLAKNLEDCLLSNQILYPDMLLRCSEIYTRRGDNLVAAKYYFSSLRIRQAYENVSLDDLEGRQLKKIIDHFKYQSDKSEIPKEKLLLLRNSAQITYKLKRIVSGSTNPNANLIWLKSCEDYFDQMLNQNQYQKLDTVFAYWQAHIPTTDLEAIVQMQSYRLTYAKVLIEQKLISQAKLQFEFLRNYLVGKFICPKQELFLREYKNFICYLLEHNYSEEFYEELPFWEEISMSDEQKGSIYNRLSDEFSSDAPLTKQAQQQMQRARDQVSSSHLVNLSALKTSTAFRSNENEISSPSGNLCNC